MDDGADVLAFERRYHALGDQPVDHLEAAHETAALEQVEQHLFERERHDLPPPQLRDADLADERGLGVGSWIAVEYPVDVLDQRQAGATEALGEQVAAGVAAMWRDASDVGRV